MALHDRDKDKRKARFRESVRVLAGALGTTPTERQYKTFAVSQIDVLSHNQVRYLYGTWADAVKDAGLSPAPNAPPRNDIVHGHKS